MKKVKVLYFGSISEAAGRKEENLETEGKLDQLLSLVEQKYPEIKDIRHRIAINQEINPDIVELSDGDEIAFLPPFAGG
jgi:molybdopterin synthase sulfur carrier subunit